MAVFLHSFCPVMWRITELYVWILCFDLCCCNPRNPVSKENLPFFYFYSTGNWTKQSAISKKWLPKISLKDWRFTPLIVSFWLRWFKFYRNINTTGKAMETGWKGSKKDTTTSENMASPRARKTTTMNRLKKKLNDAKQSLADQFEFKMFVAFVFKDKVRFPIWGP